MIVAERKVMTDIWEMLKAHERVLIVGCGTCVTVCQAGGEKEVGILATALRLMAAQSGKKLETVEFTIERQCEKEFVEQLNDKVMGVDAILSMGCGAGVQTIADRYDTKPVLPALNTTFIGIPEEQGVWSEKCVACGNCILDKTAGICPIARCAKNLLNGPCGGSQEGKCEVDQTTDCAWYLIYNRMKQLGRLQELETILPARDWTSSTHGGVRKIIREELRIEKP